MVELNNMKELKNLNIDYTLYLVTDRELMSTKNISTAVEQAILGGCTLIQHREKDISSLDFYKTACEIKEITDYHGIPLIINNRIDIALSIDAAGVHIGQNDIPASVARHIIGADKILGVSVSTVAEAKQAQDDGADYIGVGAVFPTETKKDAGLVSKKRLIEIRNAVSMPIVAIGGINKNTIPLLYDTRIDGIAVISAIISAPDIKSAAKELKLIFQRKAVK